MGYWSFGVMEFWSDPGKPVMRLAPGFIRGDRNEKKC